MGANLVLFSIICLFHADDHASLKHISFLDQLFDALGIYVFPSGE